jgi:hypothetical protein
MAVIKLGIHRDYCQKWGLWEGVREFIQNALDEDDKGNRLETSFRDGTLTITNIGSEIPMSAMAVGYSSKRDDEQARGQYGEGMKLAMLALIRAGHSVKVLTGDRIYKPEIVFDSQLGCDVLAIKLGKRMVTSKGTTVVIGGLSADEHEWVMSRFTRTHVYIGETISTPYGMILLNERMKGIVYVKGIYVCEIPGLRFGYDLNQCELDRDRAIPRQFDVEYYSSACIKHAVVSGLMSTDIAVTMACEEATDARFVFSSLCESPEYTDMFVESFKRIRAADAYVSHAESIEDRSIKVERIPPGLSGLKRHLPTPHEVNAANKARVIRRLEPDEIPKNAALAINRLNEIAWGTARFEFVITGGRTETMLEGCNVQIPIAGWVGWVQALSKRETFNWLAKQAVLAFIKGGNEVAAADLVSILAGEVSKKMAWDEHCEKLDILELD